MIANTTIEHLRSRLRGVVFTPQDEGYEAARSVFNAMINRHPALIARCTGAADVAEAVRFAREQHMELAVRGGGHNVAGLGTCDNGLVIDLAAMKGVAVDSISQTAWVEGGATWRDVDRATHSYGLAIPGGVVSTTGVGGLTLGGGIGHLSRRYGLTIDNLLEAEMVLADGRIVKSNSESYSDLFWAIRGGGGNFGIATAFRFQLHPVDTVIGGPMFWPIEQAVEVLSFYRDYIIHAPEELSCFFAFLVIPPAAPFPEELHFRKICALVWCYTGAPEQFEDVFTPVRKFTPPVLDFVGSLPYPALQSLFDLSSPPGMQHYWRADFTSELDNQAIALHVKYGSQLPTLLSTAHIYPMNGAIHHVGSADTAFRYRDVNFTQVMIGMDPDPANATQITRWVKDYWLALHPYSAGGAYVNFLMDEGQERVQATYRENYPRLAEIKRIYDPENFFHINQNIRPA